VKPVVYAFGKVLEKICLLLNLYCTVNVSQSFVQSRNEQTTARETHVTLWKSFHVAGQDQILMLFGDSISNSMWLAQYIVLVLESQWSKFLWSKLKCTVHILQSCLIRAGLILLFKIHTFWLVFIICQKLTKIISSKLSKKVTIEIEFLVLNSA